MTFIQLRKYGGVLAGVAASGLEMAQSASPEAAIGQAEAQILAIVGVAGAACIAVALAGVGWSVGAKFIKRIGGKA